MATSSSHSIDSPASDPPREELLGDSETCHHEAVQEDENDASLCRPDSSFRPPQHVRQQRPFDFQYQDHSLRINVSELAACAGFHPYKCLPKLLLEHVYQGFDGQALLRHDVQLLGLRLVSDEDQWVDLAKKAGAATLQALQTALRVPTGEQKVQSIQHAEQLRASVLQAARTSHQLSARELHILQEGARQSIHTGFGTAWEQEALDLYERQCGWPIEHRNSEVRVWDFGIDGRALGPARKGRHCSPSIPCLEDDEGGGSSTPPSKKAKVQNIESQAIDVVDLTDDAHIMKSTPNGQSFPFFSLRGAVDGIRDELITSSVATTGKEQPADETRNEVEDGDEDNWSFRQVVVECKHRMHRVQPTPPLYEMIQATTYCLMYQTEVAELLQVLRIEPPKKQSGRETQKEHRQNSVAIIDTPTTGVLSESVSVPLDTQDVAPTNKESGRALSSMTISVCRLTVDDPVFGHRQNWYAVVVPRLVEWTKGVYHVRRHDELRYRLLMALATTEHMEEAWSVLYEQLDWLHDCDTSYRRDIAVAQGSSII